MSATNTDVLSEQISVDTSQTSTKSKLWPATFLISGTCIGGGMLALPVQLAEAGFGLSLLGLMLCWAFMTYTGLLLVEATLWVKNEAHFSSLSRILIGNWAKVIALVVYLFMNYVSLIAYTAGGVSLVSSWAKSLSGVSIDYIHGCFGFTVVFGLVVYLGAVFVGKFNALLMGVLIAAYFGLVSMGIGMVEANNLTFKFGIKEGLGIFSMILATFSYQMVVPSVCSYLKYDAQTLKKAVLMGTTIPFVTYALWLLVIHGAIALDGEHGLRQAWLDGASATTSLRAKFNHWSLIVFVDMFAFLALLTSYLGLSLALFEFLRDCLREIKITLSRNMIFILTFVPVAVLASLYPRALIQCLDISGGYGDTILSGMIPALMVWYGRYKKKLTGSFTVPGGKVGLIASFIFFFAILVLQHY